MQHKRWWFSKWGQGIFQCGSVSLQLLCIFKPNPTKQKQSPTKLTKCTMARRLLGWDGCFYTSNSFKPRQSKGCTWLSGTFCKSQMNNSQAAYLHISVHSSIPNASGQAKLLRKYTQAHILLSSLSNRATQWWPRTRAEIKQILSPNVFP